ncbi:MAG: hypothetical protein BGO67_00165 [Alphaproteobacteria bacterium 41-28]|nr:MAG: hypothetical protein BGO67_00165 [Alphaproteobacteria bacterium 41-28]
MVFYYDQGIGIEKDLKEAENWYTKVDNPTSFKNWQKERRIEVTLPLIRMDSTPRQVPAP